MECERATRRGAARPPRNSHRCLRLPVLHPKRVLLRDAAFAAEAGHKHGAFTGWKTFNAFVADQLPLVDPLDFRPFDAWRSRANRARLWVKQATDVAAGGQPPLKDKFQATFQMTLLGNALLARLWESHRYRVLPFPGGRGTGEVIEVYPGATLRQMGLSKYKSQPSEEQSASPSPPAPPRGITLDVDSSGWLPSAAGTARAARSLDYDAADAFRRSLRRRSFTRKEPAMRRWRATRY